ncbi:hypothetical protein RND81_14G089100 [Saponaria officinalis]|uniref:Uncharacterized protein n=1 Tax=Saponaria officinalis TaxID=3572 RepID=A0AAW1GMF6_SAPOF
MPGYISSTSKTQKNTQKFQQNPQNYTQNSASSSTNDDLLPRQLRKKPNKRSTQKVCLEGYVNPQNDDVLPRTKSLTDEDLEELKGCIDLGFGFSYDEIPELCNTLPALELCYSMSQKFFDEHSFNSHCFGDKCSDSVSFSGSNENSSSSSSSMPTWKISSPGDDPEDVKARLKFWAQAVACTVKLCNSS